MEKSCAKLNFKLFIAEKSRHVMTEDLEKLKKIAKEYSDNLAKLGKELSEIQFNYKVIENTTKQYWQNRINEFKKYNEKGIEYYTQVHALMNLVDKEQSGLFLLSISKLRQIELKISSDMEEVKQNPSIVKSKDNQQSKWSKELREKLIESSNACLHHEMDMNKFFREFYETHLKKILE
jgi:argininosuccinate lyase